jgi:hypothetical protein
VDAPDMDKESELKNMGVTPLFLFMTTSKRLIKAACAFVRNCENKNIEGAGEMPFLCDASYREMRDAVCDFQVEENEDHDPDFLK